MVAGLNLTTDITSNHSTADVTSDSNQVVVTGLLPHTNYVFHVAAVNGEGIGPYSATFVARTAEDGKLMTAYKSTI